MPEQGFLGLEDDQFWGDPFATKSEVVARLFQEEFRGLALDGPAGPVDLGARETLPVVGTRVLSLRENPKLPLQTTTVLAATELTRNFTRVGMAMSQEFLPSRGAPRRQPKRPPIGKTEVSVRIDLREQLDVPWQPGEYLVTLLARDLVSNRVRLRLVAGGDYQDPAVAEFLAQERKKLRPRPVWPPAAKPWPTYERYAPQPTAIDEDPVRSPDIPAEPGIALACKRVQVALPRTPVLVAGAFRLPVKPWHLVHPPRQVEDEQGQQVVVDDIAWPEDAGKRPTAIVPITLISTGTVSPPPFVWHLRVPTWDRVDPRAEENEVTGFFTLDLQQLGNVKARPQTNFLYAFSAEAMTGPTPLAIVSEAMLQPELDR